LLIVAAWIFSVAGILLAGLALFALWQWSDADRLRARLRSLEEELREEDVEYERSGDDAVED
jgi:hypothetical protein